MLKKKRKSLGEKSDERALAAIKKAGWEMLEYPPAFPEGSRLQLHVARKLVPEDDGTTTRLYESAHTLDDLARQVDRREREETPKDPQLVPKPPVRVFDGVRDSVRR